MERDVPWLFLDPRTRLGGVLLVYCRDAATKAGIHYEAAGKELLSFNEACSRSAIEFCATSWIDQLP
jgi:hypothetical protein